MGSRLTLWAVDPLRVLDALTKEEVSNAKEDSLHLQHALWRVYKSSDVGDVVQLILDGYRRWWIGSFVESLRLSPWMLNKEDVEHVERLLSIFLRGLDCGTTIRKAPPSVCHSAFPMAPRCDADLRFAALSSSDFEFLRLFLAERLREDDRRYIRPSGLVGVACEGADDWDAWVRQVIREIAYPLLNVPSPAMLSFPG